VVNAVSLGGGDRGRVAPWTAHLNPALAVGHRGRSPGVHLTPIPEADIGRHFWLSPAGVRHAGHSLCLPLRSPSACS
jgi:hypothetical protein